MAVQLILKNSTIEDRRPSANQLANGELSLNYNEQGAFVCCRDTAGNVQQLGGVKFSDDAPGEPVYGTWWFNTALATLYVFDGNTWQEAGGSGGGGGSTVIVGGQGIDVTTVGTTSTLDADLNENKGLGFDSGLIEIKAGANISFDADGKIQADVDSLSFKGVLDFTSDAVPGGAASGDAYANDGTGNGTAAWQATWGSNPSTSPGDLTVYNGTNWSYIPTGGVTVQTDLGLDNRDANTLDITSSTGDDVTIPAATDALAGLLTGPDKSSLNDLIAGGTPSGGTGDRPDSPSVGDLFFDTDLDLLLVWNGSDWEPVSPPQDPGQWTRTGTELEPINPGDTVYVTAANGTKNITLNPDGSAAFADDVNAQNAVITDDVNLGGNIVNTVTDGDQDIVCDGEGLVKLTEYNLNPMEVVTKHDIGTAANEVPVCGMLGSLAFQSSLALTSPVAVAELSATAPVGSIARVNDGTASLGWSDIATGGGSTNYIVWKSGTNWTVLGA